MSVKIKVDTAVWKKMRSNLFKSRKGQLNVGFFEDAVYADGLNVAQVAKWQEEGTVKIPPRPFMRYLVFALEKDLKFGAEAAKLMHRIALGQLTVERVYAMLGTEMAEDLRKIISAWDIPPNAPYTIAEKGFDNPLIHTGKMYMSADWEIGRRGGVS